MIFITCGEGGGTGTGAALSSPRLPRNGILTVAVVTKPFDFEGSKRKFTADEGTMRLKDNVDTLIVVPNQRTSGRRQKTPILEAFKRIDSVLHQGVKALPTYNCSRPYQRRLCGCPHHYE